MDTQLLVNFHNQEEEVIFRCERFLKATKEFTTCCIQCYVRIATFAKYDARITNGNFEQCRNFGN